MKHVCRICFIEIPNLNFDTLKTYEPLQIQMQLVICVPEMVVNLVKDPVFCKSCVSALHSAYNFKNLCLCTGEHIQNYICKTLYSESIDIIDILKYFQHNTVSEVCEDNFEGKDIWKESFVATPNMEHFLSDLVDGHSVNIENIHQHFVTLPINASNKVVNANNVTTNRFISKYLEPAKQNGTVDKLNDVGNIPNQLLVIEQEGEVGDQDFLVEEDISFLPKLESSLACEGFGENSFEGVKCGDHPTDMKIMNNESDWTNLQTKA